MGGKLVLLERFHTISFVVTTFTRDKLYIPVSLRYVSGEGRFDFIFSAASKTGVVVVGIVLFDVGHKVGDILCLIRTAVTDVEHLGVLLLLLLLQCGGRWSCESSGQLLKGLQSLKQGKTLVVHFGLKTNYNINLYRVYIKLGT